MNLSGIVVTLAPPAFDDAVAALGALPGVRVHQQDRASFRVVVTQEASSNGAQEEGFRRLLLVPGVAHAELVYHWFDEEPAPLVQLGGRR